MTEQVMGILIAKRLLLAIELVLYFFFVFWDIFN
jgi:hypothetical protein